MTAPAPEFSRIVPLTRVGSEPFRQHIAATEDERSRLAKRFDLLALARLEADIELMHEAAGTILMTAAFEAQFAQECTVTLEPVEGGVSETFRLRYGSVEAEVDAPGGEDDPAFELLTGEAIDIGEAVAQEFSLALPPFPRAPEAVVEGVPAEEPAEGPFAILRRLGGDQPQ
jgi:uncharacterized metal-binding protein YceD (DUF177 family)